MSKIMITNLNENEILTHIEVFKPEWYFDAIPDMIERIFIRTKAMRKLGYINFESEYLNKSSLEFAMDSYRKEKELETQWLDKY